ncbi:MAG: STAS domain-containing protein [Terriglobia bacterium]
MATTPTSGPSSETKLRISIRDDCTHVACAGRLTADVAPAFKSEMRELIPKARRVVLDLSQVSYLDSAGLGAVVSSYVSARAAGCPMELINLSPRVRELLGVTKLLSVFESCGQFPFRMP